MKKGLIPWRRNREVPVRREEGNPFLALHQSMNDLFDNFFTEFEEGVRGPLTGRLAILDMLDRRWREVGVAKEPTCPICSA